MNFSYINHTINSVDVAKNEDVGSCPVFVDVKCQIDGTESQ